MMRNAEEIKRRLDRVKAEKSYTEAIIGLCDVTYEIGLDACHERNLLKEEIENLRAILLGNGNPETAVVIRLGEVERQMAKSNKSLENIERALLGDVETQSKGEKSLIDKISCWDDFNKDFKRVKWVVYGIIVAEIVTILIRLL
jgi:hypothetical protein